MAHICECGLATDDLAFLHTHLTATGHRERVPWWSLFSRVTITTQLPAPSHRRITTMTGNNFGSSAASISDGSESGERPGNGWLFTPAGIQKTGNAL